jgi:hypothetical protein
LQDNFFQDKDTMENTQEQSVSTPERQRISESHTETLSVTRSVDCIVLEGDLAVFRVARTHVFDNAQAPANFKAMMPDSAQQGFAKVRDIRAYLKGKVSTIKTQDKLQLVSPEFRARAQRDGFVAAWEQEGKQHVTGQLFEAFEQGTVQLDDLVTPDYGGHMLFDRKGGVLPTALYFDYMNGNFRNGAYDLAKAIEVLKLDPRVRQVYTGRSYNKSKFDEAKWAIQEVPYYNNSPGCSQNLAFIFSPTQEDMTRMWELMPKLNKQYPSTTTHEAVFVLDLLGLRAAGATKHDRYGMSDEYSSTDSGDDD